MGNTRREKLERYRSTADALPYLLWTLGPNSARRCPHHIKRHGLILRARDYWWDDHFPPDGKGCNCRVRAATQREFDDLKRRGVRAAPSEETAIRDEKGRLTGHHREVLIPVKTAPLDDDE